MDPLMYGIPATTPQPPPPSPPKLTLPPPFIQGILPNRHENFPTDYLRHTNFENARLASPRFKTENNIISDGLGSNNVRETLVISPNDVSVHEGNKRRRYCECSSANAYCDSCGCVESVDCKNNPEHENSLPKRRKEIKCHNPLQNGTSTTLATVRDCKSSMCQNQHFPYFKENVGCLDGYRYDGCHSNFNTEQGTSNDNFDSWEKQRSAIVAELMEDETDFADDVMVDRYCKTLEALLVPEHNGESQQIDQDDMSNPCKDTPEALAFGRTRRKLFPTDADEAKP